MNRFKFSLLLPAICILALAGCAGAPASPGQTAGQPAPDTQVAKNDASQPDQDEQCNTDLETGSHVHKHTVCTTQQDCEIMEQSMSALRSHGSGSISH